MKAVKWILIGMIVLVVGVVVYITSVFDPNDFKPQVVDQVKQQTGRDLTISKDLTWTFFPTLGIELGGIALSNPEGFNLASMVEVNQVVAEVALMPLFSKQVEISQLNLDGLKLNLVTQKGGKTSFDGLSQDEKKKTEEAPAGSNQIQLDSLNIGGVSITNTEINLVDEAAEVTQTFLLKSLTLGQFSLGQFASLDYEFAAKLPDMELKSLGQGQLRVSKDLKQLQVEDFKVENTVTGEGIPNKQLIATLLSNIQVALDSQNLTVELNEFVAADIRGSGKLDIAYGRQVPSIQASLDFGDIDLDKMLPKSEATEDEQASTSQPAVEPDLRGMKSVNADVKLTAKSIKVANLLTQNWALNFKLKDGVLNVSQLSSDLYQGKLKATARLDGRKAIAQYQFDKVLQGVQVGDLLKDAAEIDFLSGTASFNVKGSGRSLLPDNIKKNLDAKGKFDVADGALYGVNIPHMLRSAQAKLKGDMSSAQASEQKTDFSSLTGSFNVKNGVASNPDLLMASPLIRVKGGGKANIVNESIDYKLTTNVVGSLQGQGGSDDMKGLEIPFAIKGTFQEPKFSLDTSGLMDAKIKQETEKVKDKAKKKLKDSLLEKFGGF